MFFFYLAVASSHDGMCTLNIISVLWFNVVHTAGTDVCNSKSTLYLPNAPVYNCFHGRHPFSLGYIHIIISIQ